MKCETKQARTASHLKDVIPQGWPEYPNECPSDQKNSGISEKTFLSKKGLILKGHRPLTLSDLHTQMLQIILQGHLGVEKCQLKARDCIFWLCISNDIMNTTINCPTYIQFLKR